MDGKWKHAIAFTGLVPLLAAGVGDAEPLRQPSLSEIIAACRDGQTASLPLPYTDVPANHWSRPALSEIYYCGADRLDPERGVLTRLLSTPDTIAIEGREIRLDVFLWRDFMPMADTKLQGTLTLRTVQGDRLPDRVAIDRVWVVNGDRVWETQPTGEERNNPPELNEAIVRRGPTWEVGSSVETVVQLRDRLTGQTYLLKGANAVIEATY
jgi:hypothetical protein